MTTLASIRERLDAAKPVTNPDQHDLAVTNPADWSGIAPPPRLWSLDRWIPLGQATLLTGKGGVGKSLLTQQLATSIALGQPLLGRATRQAKALYLTCEDDLDELHRRQDAICKALGVEMAALDGKLFLSALAGETGNHLATFDATGALTVTERYREVERFALNNTIGFIALDNASHLMIGDHNDLSSVAAFLGLLNGLALRIGGAVILLHHPNKAGADWLGSVAWENQVRSRLVLKPSDIDGDPDARSLQNPKANYSASGGRLDFRWHKGAFVHDDDLPDDVHAELNRTIAASTDNAIFVACLRERTRQRRAVSDRRSAAYAPTVFAIMPEAKSIGKDRLTSAMDRLFRIGVIERAELWRGADRKPVYGLRETAERGANDCGRRAGDACPEFVDFPQVIENVAGDGAGDGAGNTVRETQATILETAENCEKSAGDVRATHTPP